VKVGRVDLDGLQRDRDQLFAEAVEAYRRGEKWWPDAEFERAHITPEQDARFETDPWEDAIAAYVAPLAEVRLAGVARDVLKVEISKLGRAEQLRIISVLTQLGFAPGKKDRNGRLYVRVTHDAL
jgi:predicted P-loop ATPase